MSDEHDAALDPGLLDDLTTMPIGELRALRDRCVAYETGLSYLRRMVQGSLDIVNRELARRASGGEPVDVAGLVDELPNILSEMPRPGGVGRAPQEMMPTDVDPVLSSEYDELVADGRVSNVAEQSAVEVAALLDRLDSLEKRLSEKRSAFHERIDALGAELGRRYQTGEATADERLREAR